MYTMSQVSKLIRGYIEKGGEAHQMDEGVLLEGDWLLYDSRGKLKTIVIREVFVTSWSSGQTIRKYNKCPKKYQKIIDNL